MSSATLVCEVFVIAESLWASYSMQTSVIACAFLELQAYHVLFNLATSDSS